MDAMLLILDNNVIKKEYANYFPILINNQPIINFY
jgi:hypothetical protein